MMKQFWNIFIMAFFGASICFAQSPDRPIHERTIRNNSAIENEVFSLVYGNPAMRSLQHTNTLTTLQLNGEYKKEELPSIVQEGDGLRMGTVDVASFIRKKNSSLWGEAYYKNGKQLGKCWNETSDYALLYPYVMGDTIGGDLKSEQYFFSGGYAYNTSKYIIGVEGAYKAAIEYRNADPRPKNLTGDLNVKIGAAKYLSPNYLIGIAGYARKYKQTNDLAFYNELGVPNIYHFTGLGTDYYRFRGAKGESFYKGHAFGASMELLPTQATGFSASIHYQNFQFDKVISSLNELPMAKVKEDEVNGEVAWKSTNNSAFQKGIRGGFQYVRRRGSENIFGAAYGNVFPQIGSQEKYMNKMYEASLAGVLEYTIAHGPTLSLLGQVDYSHIHTTYLYPQREMKVYFTTGKIDFRIAYPYKEWLFCGALGVESRFNNYAQLNLGDNPSNGKQALQTPLINNFEALQVNAHTVHTQFRTDYSWNKKHSLFLAVNYIYGKDQRTANSHNVIGSLGFSF